MSHDGALFLLLLGTAGAALASTLPALARGPSPLGSDGTSIDANVMFLRAPATALAHLPAVTFTMGSTTEEVQAAFADCQREPLKGRCQLDEFGDERPERNVTVSSFWMMRKEVTVREYERCVKARRCAAAPYFRGAQRFRRDDYPASLSSWQDARDYCGFWGGRLPTEAEFERAARGPKRRRYPWGNLYNPLVSNHGQLASDRTNDIDGYLELAPVGSHLDGATPNGILDLAGNVSEWVFDRYAPEYDVRDLKDPLGPVAGSGSNQRVIRGGDYESPRAQLRGADRTGLLPTARKPTVGFRCVRSTRNEAER